MGRSVRRKSTGLKRTGSGARISKSNGSSEHWGETMTEYVLCLTNEGYPASLIVGKVYRRLPDPDAEAHQFIRVIDEDAAEAEGYLYPAAMFIAVELPDAAKRVLMGSHTG